MAKYVGQHARITDSEVAMELCDESGRIATFDNITWALNIIDYVHHEIHAGSTFRCQANADPAASLIIAFRTPPGLKKAHFLFEWVAESSGYVQLKEGVTITAGSGTQRSAKNSNRSSSKTSMLMAIDATGTEVPGFVMIDPTISGGTIVSDKRFYTDDKQGGQTGSRRSEIILAPATDYAIQFTSTDGNKGIQLRCEWYEHTDKS